MSRLRRESITGGTKSTGTLIGDEPDFIRHLETMHRIPSSVLSSLPDEALAQFHETEHSNPLWTTGPHHT
jgi:hypothetical protein